jgi:4-aminobutyrate aminotransferase-like enzyme
MVARPIGPDLAAKIAEQLLGAERLIVLRDSFQDGATRGGHSMSVRAQVFEHIFSPRHSHILLFVKPISARTPDALAFARHSERKWCKIYP